jgi:hypothetical protein
MRSGGNIHRAGAITAAVVVLAGAFAGAYVARQRADAASLAPIVIVMMENREDTALTSSNAPYLTSLKTTGRYFSSYYSPVHPSFPNYLAVASGSTYGNTGGGAKPGAFPGDNIWHQLTQAGVSWGVYEEHMPSVCYAGTSATVTTPTKDTYKINHNPATVFATVFSSSECQNVRPLSQMPSTLPQLSFVTPSYCDDMHGFADASYPPDCQVGTTALTRRGDAWLQDHVEGWRAQGALVVITFDEGKTDAGGGGRVYTAEVGPGITPAVVPTTLNHYSLLAALEDRFGVPRLNNAVGATPIPLDPSGTVSPTPTPAPGTTVFSDDFSSGKFANWSGVTRLTIDPGVGGDAPPSASANVSGQSAWAYRTLAATMSNACVSANVQVSNNGGNAVDLLRFRTSGNGPLIKALVSATGVLKIRNDLAGVSKTSSVPLAAGWHSLSLCGSIGPGSAWSLYRDGSAVVSGWVTDTGATPIGRFNIGDSAAKTFAARFDDVRVWAPTG